MGYTKRFEDNYELADKLYNKAGAFIQYLLKSSFKGEKFKDHEKSEKRITKNDN